MASRAVWKGQLRLSLVSIPVEIHSATKTASRVSFRQIHGPSGKPVRYEKTVPGIGPVKSADILKGYEVGDDEYLLIDPEEIDAVRLETRKTLELVQFVGACEISPLYFDKPYYIVPADDLAEDAYRVVRDALRASEKVGLGQLTMRGREHLCAIKPCGGGLLLETLFYADEIKNADPLFHEIAEASADEDLLDVATQLIARKTAPFAAEAFIDHYDLALRELLDAKRRSRSTPRAKTGDDRDLPQGGNVVDLMAALKESLKESGTAGRKGAAGRLARGEARPGPGASAAGADPAGKAGGKTGSKTGPKTAGKAAPRAGGASRSKKSA